MKTGNGIVAEMVSAAGALLVANLANVMIGNGDVPADWEDSFIIKHLKREGRHTGER